ncbi:hypothetical protein O3P69_011575 [Scylla paramamosain]|uniref:Uncharacterized protein n=1 Tax=Scylla paramamosain TaxID=85552 RepID=A0AAW0T8A9_SCYPA
MQGVGDERPTDTRKWAALLNAFLSSRADFHNSYISVSQKLRSVDQLGLRSLLIFLPPDLYWATLGRRLTPAKVTWPHRGRRSFGNQGKRRRGASSPFRSFPFSRITLVTFTVSPTSAARGHKMKNEEVVRGGSM